jgi:hypothetical protein
LPRYQFRLAARCIQSCCCCESLNYSLLLSDLNRRPLNGQRPQRATSKVDSL